MVLCVNAKATELHKIQLTDYFPHLSQYRGMHDAWCMLTVLNLSYISISCTNTTEWIVKEMRGNVGALIWSIDLPSRWEDNIKMVL
jgi:hypothetical protein